MTTTAKQLLDQVMALEDDDRLELIDHLNMARDWEPSTNPEYVAAWEAEIKNRLDDIDTGKANMIPAEDVVKRLRAQARRDAQKS